MFEVTLRREYSASRCPISCGSASRWSRQYLRAGCYPALTLQAPGPTNDELPLKAIATGWEPGSRARLQCGKLIAISLLLGLQLLSAQQDKPFLIHVTDDRTGRGVPLVELETLNDITFVTDSAGVAAIGDTALQGHAVVFHRTQSRLRVPAEVLRSGRDQAAGLTRRTRGTENPSPQYRRANVPHHRGRNLPGQRGRRSARPYRTTSPQRRRGGSGHLGCGDPSRPHLLDLGRHAGARKLQLRSLRRDVRIAGS